MRMIFLLAASIPFFATAQQEAPTPVWANAEVMTEERAGTLISFARDQLFWDKAKLFDGKTTVTAVNDDERRSIPIPRVDAMWMVSYGSMVGEQLRCGLDGQALAKKLFTPFWARYKQEKQIVFGLTLMGLASNDVTNRRAHVVCTESEKEDLRRIAAFLMEPSKKP